MAGVPPANQIALPLDWPVADREEDFLLSGCNRAAFDHLRRWALWPVMASVLTGSRREDSVSAFVNGSRCDTYTM